MTAFLDIRVAVSDDDFQRFLDRLASSAVTITATDEDGEELSTAPVGVVDKNGIPWLESVHASTRTQTKDGRWKRLKGVTEEQRDAAEAAWKQANPTPTGAAAVQAVFTPPTAVAPEPPAINPAPASVTIPPQVPASAPVATAPVTAAPVAAPAATAPVFIPGMTPPAPAPVAVVEDKPVTLEDIGTAFGTLQGKFGELSGDFIAKIYEAAGIADPNQMVNDESARKRLFDVLTRTIEAN